jgi:hypothetical protein
MVPQLDAKVGQLVAVAPPEPLKLRQSAMLKVVFKNAEGRDFAFALSGTRRVQVQLMLQSGLQESGSVVFDNI